ncbi:MAG: hypothetical protein ACI86H_002533 [bacterium]|jgi:hypothetical protein
MTEAIESPAEKKEKMMSQFKRIDHFLQSKSSIFYREYDQHNLQIAKIREQLQFQDKELLQLAEKEGFTSDLNAVLAIDAEDGVSNQLNQMTVSIARVANPSFCTYLSKTGLDLINSHAEKNYYSKIPKETDAVIFMTNPLVVFNLLHKFITYLQKQAPFIKIYIINRIARWFFRFIQFILEYDQFEKLVQVTFLQEKRLNPYKHQFLQTIRFLCKEAKENVLDNEKPIFINDLRRLYIILSRVLLVANARGITPPDEISEVLKELVPILNLETSALKKDAVYDDFEAYHFTIPTLKKTFLEHYNQLQKQKSKHLLHFLGYLHPDDRTTILKTLYKKSKTYVIKLFLKIRQIYESDKNGFSDYYQDLATGIQKVVTYQDVRNDSTVSSELIQEAFWKEILYLEKTETSKVEELGLNTQETSLESHQLFDAFFDDAPQARKSTKLLQLAGITFCYITFEFGKYHFNLFRYGEVVMMGLPDQMHKSILKYIKNSGQITQKEKEVLESEVPSLRNLMSKVIPKAKTYPHLNLYDDNNKLQLLPLKNILESLHGKIPVNNPIFLKEHEDREFILMILLEIERWFAKQKNISVDEVTPDTIIPILNSDEELDKFFAEFRQTSIGRLYEEELKSSLQLKDYFYQQLVLNNRIKKRLLEYERTRLTTKAESTSIAERFDAVTKYSKDQEESDQSSMFSPYVVREKTFKELAKRPEKKQGYLFNLSRIPFRFLAFEFGKPRLTLFTFADVITMNLGARERKTLLNYLFETKQLDKEELAIFHKEMLSLIFITRTMIQNVRWQDAQYESKNHTIIDFTEFARKLAIADRVIRKNIKQLVAFKDHVQILLEGVSEVERSISRHTGESFLKLSPEKVAQLFNDQETVIQLYNQVRRTAFGRQHLENWNITGSTFEQIKIKLFESYQLSLCLMQYHKKQFN